MPNLGVRSPRIGIFPKNIMKRKISKVIKKEKIFATVDSYPVEGILSDMSELVLKIQRGLIMPALIFSHHKIANTITFFGASRIKPPAQAKAELDAVLKKSKKSKNFKKLLADAERAVEMSRYYAWTEELAFRLQKWVDDANPAPEQRLYIMTGGGPGIMEAASKGAYMAGGVPVGATIPISSEEKRNEYVDKGVWFQFNYFFMRKFWLLAMARAVVVCPGGFGTFDEFFEIITLIKTGKEKKIPLVLLDREFWESVVNFDELIKKDVITKTDMKLIHFASSVDDAFNFITQNL